MVHSERRSPNFLTARTSASRRAVVGVDGGGTKTEAVILDARDQVLGQGIAGPSNPLRIGIANAAAAVREAIDKACSNGHVRREDIISAQIGLAGARRLELSLRMREALSNLGISDVQVSGDAEIALYGTTDGGPGVVVIAGTGSVCCGVNARGRRVWAGGWGPIAGDEGGGAWIARRAIKAIAHASDGRGPKTTLMSAACNYFHVTTPDDLSTAIYAPTITNERLAGFGKHVVDAAKAKDTVAREILNEGAKELGLMVAAVVRNLKLETERFQVGYVGGVFNSAGELILAPMREQLKEIAPNAFLAPPSFAPAVAAARMARERANHVALAV
ncbi:MAG TPA: BadF/BadG/BcrA/BcrD ATPase family protein [Pyrinomonadaceae bacterium]|nr:BadF/BadG/BcrA/BcrD ATPase family protein [Pyrinomonadaceae bacterium]